MMWPQWLILLILVLLPSTSSATITINAATSANWSSATDPETLTYTNPACATGDDVLYLSWCGADTVSIVSITYDGMALTQKPGAAIPHTTANLQCDVWYLINPNNGSNLTVSIDVSAGTAAVGATQSFCGVHQTTPHGASATAEGGSVTATVNVAGTLPGSIVVDATAVGDAGDTLTAGAGQTQQWTDARGVAGSGIRAAGSTEAGGGAVTMSNTVSAVDSWVITAFEVFENTTAARRRWPRFSP